MKATINKLFPIAVALALMATISWAEVVVTPLINNYCVGGTPQPCLDPLSMGVQATTPQPVPDPPPEIIEEDEAPGESPMNFGLCLFGCQGNLACVAGCVGTANFGSVDSSDGEIVDNPDWGSIP